jgi:hypothetical protein
MDAVVQEINLRSDSTIPAFGQHATISKEKGGKRNIMNREIELMGQGIIIAYFSCY